MLDQQLSQQMSSKGIGVADMMLKQLMRNAGVDQRSGASGAGARAASAAAPTRGSWRRR